jgi:hypothetical protein
VYALVKKDKPLNELREGMLDQLDVFLQLGESTLFVTPQQKYISLLPTLIPLSGVRKTCFHHAVMIRHLFLRPAAWLT